MATDPADAAYTGYMLAVLFVLPSDEGLETDNRDSIENLGNHRYSRTKNKRSPFVRRT